MTFEPDFLELMVSTAEYKNAASKTMYGVTSFGSATAMRCHLTYRQAVVRLDEQEQANSTAQLEAPPLGYEVGGIATPSIAMAGQITLPDGHGARRVLSV